MTDVPPYRQFRYLALVFVGGACGALARWGLLEAMSDEFAAIASANLLGSLLLGLLLGVLTAIGPDDGPRRVIRLAVGTGFLGAFTTYSTFSGQAVELWFQEGTQLWALYAFGSVIGGLLLAAIGLGVGSLIGRGARERQRA